MRVVFKLPRFKLPFFYAMDLSSFCVLVQRDTVIIHTVHLKDCVSGKVEKSSNLCPGVGFLQGGSLNITTLQIFLKNRLYSYFNSYIEVLHLRLNFNFVNKVIKLFFKVGRK